MPYILHMDMDAFFVSCEIQEDPSLKGKPVIIGSKDGRGIVSTCSYEARKYGVHSAMPGRQAYRLCPEGIFLKGRGALYRQYAEQVREIVREHVPDTAFASIDEFYCDLTGFERFYGAWDYARQLRHAIISGTGLPVSMGLARSKTLAKMATNAAKPNGEKFVRPGEEHDFMAPLPISAIPMVGPKFTQKLADLGLHKIEQLLDFDLDAFEQRFGKMGRSLYFKIHGEGGRFGAPRERKSIGVERTLSEDTLDEDYLRRLLLGMAEKLAHQLRNKRLTSGCVNIKLRYHDFKTYTRQMTVPPTADDRKIHAAALQLFRQNWNPNKAVRLIGVRCTALQTAAEQANLFDNREKQSKLETVLDELKTKHGLQSVHRAAATLKRKPADHPPKDGE